jgi:cyclopropane fatty-acyl-phospholipid synthase-like methyltransferase
MRWSEACERNREPILTVLRQWLPPGARVLEIGSGSGQHAVAFSRSLDGVQWQASEHPEALAPLVERLRSEGVRPDALALDVQERQQWPSCEFEAVFSANTCHILPPAGVSSLLALAAAVLQPGGLLLLYGPFQDGGVHTAASNAAFDAHLRSLDPRMGVRDAIALRAEAGALGLSAEAEVAMPANNRMLIFRRNADPSG